MAVLRKHQSLIEVSYRCTLGTFAIYLLVIKLFNLKTFTNVFGKVRCISLTIIKACLPLLSLWEITHSSVLMGIGEATQLLWGTFERLSPLTHSMNCRETINNDLLMRHYLVEEYLVETTEINYPLSPWKTI